MQVLLSPGPYLCYLLVSLRSPQRTYVGVTNHFDRRLRQHNGELVGGARATRVGRPWKCLLTVEGFTCKQSSMQFEWMWKHMAPIKSHGKKSRLTKLLALLQKERWTEQAPLAASVPLVITIHNYDDDDNITNNPFLQQTLLENKELPEHVKVQIISREGDKEG